MMNAASTWLLKSGFASWMMPWYIWAKLPLTSPVEIDTSFGGVGILNRVPVCDIWLMWSSDGPLILMIAEPEPAGVLKFSICAHTRKLVSVIWLLFVPWKFLVLSVIVTVMRRSA